MEEVEEEARKLKKEEGEWRMEGVHIHIHIHVQWNHRENHTYMRTHIRKCIYTPSVSACGNQTVHTQAGAICNVNGGNENKQSY